MQPRRACSGVCHQWEAGTDPQIAPRRQVAVPWAEGEQQSHRGAAHTKTASVHKFTLVLPHRNTGPQLPGQVLVLMLRGEEAGWVPVLGR